MRRLSRFRLFTAAMAALATAAILGPVSATAATSAPAAPGTTATATAMPRYNHVFYLVEENHGFDQIVGLGCLAATCDTADIKPMTPLFAVKPGAAATTVPSSLLHPTAPVRNVAERGTAGAPAPTASTTPPAPAHGKWVAVPSPNLSTNDNNLAPVSAAAPDNVWAVGDYYTQDNPNVFRNLALH